LWIEVVNNNNDGGSDNENGFVDEERGELDEMEEEASRQWPSIGYQVRSL
jgi:hypothetical protein